jgi:oligosaccharyltransferase complex subunit delta (ribophorin II)
LLKITKTQKDLPIQLLSSTRPLSATLVLASFGSSQGYNSHVFDLEVQTDPNVSPPKYENPLRYGKLAQINHIFKPDPKSPPKIISLFFVLAVLATLPILIGAVCMELNM